MGVLRLFAQFVVLGAQRGQLRLVALVQRLDALFELRVRGALGVQRLAQRPEFLRLCTGRRGRRGRRLWRGPLGQGLCARLDPCKRVLNPLFEFG
jgi:hypothetical protein